MSSTRIFFLIFVCSSILTQAQFKKGNWLVEGSVGNINISNNTFEYTEESLTDKTEYSSFNFSLNPKAGYFIIDDIAIGLTLGFDFYNSSSESFNPEGIKDRESESKRTSISFAPFFRYYFSAIPNSNLWFYYQIDGGMTTYLSDEMEYTSFNISGQITSKSKYEYPEKYFSYFVEGLVGLNYFLAENVAFNTAIGYTYNKSSETSEYTDTTIGFPDFHHKTEYRTTSSNISWNFGFTMIIP